MEVRVEELFLRYAHAHRIDKWTSGILLFASQDVRIGNYPAYKWLRTYWQERVSKEYLAIMPYPNWTKTVCDIPLPDGNGKIGPAVTSFEVIQDSGAGHVLVKCRLIKGGKKHQIRIHAKERGVPLLGDHVYGGARSRVRNGQLLHAWKLAINLPYEKTVFQAPIPNDFRSLGFNWDELDKGANGVCNFG
jgi:23S rRNA pseudouridine1911/1915/1917 synthase